MGSAYGRRPERAHFNARHRWEPLALSKKDLVSGWHALEEYGSSAMELRHLHLFIAVDEEAADVAA